MHISTTGLSIKQLVQAMSHADYVSALEVQGHWKRSLGSASMHDKHQASWDMDMPAQAARPKHPPRTFTPAHMGTCMA